MRRKRSVPVISATSRDSEEVVFVSDDEGNADLSLEILAKAGSREVHTNRIQSSVAPGTSSDGDFLSGLILVSDDDESSRGSDAERDDNVSHADRQKGNEASANLEDTPCTSVLQAATLTEAQQTDRIEGAEQHQKNGKKEKKKKMKKKLAGADVDDSGKPERDMLFKVIADDGEDNLAMRELLRGPRYFDLPEEKTCYRCGNVGHFAADCTEERKKACYVCGSLDHEQKDCPQGSCFICKGIGHFAKSCPNKASQINKVHDYAKTCLRCGVEGHDMYVCNRDYRPEDLEVIRCYICKKFGHLCCADVVDISDVQVSCYNCGELGHTGVGCAKRRIGNSDDKQPVKLCYKCGEEGHFARGCG